MTNARRSPLGVPHIGLVDNDLTFLLVGALMSTFLLFCSFYFVTLFLVSQWGTIMADDHRPLTWMSFNPNLAFSVESLLFESCKRLATTSSMIVGHCTIQV